MQSNPISFSISRQRQTALLVALVCSGWMSAAHAAPTCNSVVATPADGIIVAGSTVTNSDPDACFDNAVTPITNNGTVNNNAGSGLTNVGALGGSGSLRNYGAFENYAGAQLTSTGFIRNYQTGVLTNSGTWSTSASARNDGQWINAAGATMRQGLIDHYSGATFTNNGTLSISESAIFSGATFTNNGSIVDVSSTTFTYIYNQGAFHNNAGGSVDISVFTSQSVMTNAGAIKAKLSFSNYGALDNKSGGSIENTAQLRNLAAAVLNNEGALRNKTGATLRNVGALKNSGTVEIDTGSAVTDVGTFTQTAGTATVNGSMTQSAVSIFGGDLTGTGTITAPVTLSGGRIVSDALTIDGDLLFVDGSLLTTIGATEFTVLSVTGTAYLTSGTFAFDFGSYIPEVGESWLFLSGLIEGDLSGYALAIEQIGNVSFELQFVEGGLALTAVETVPVPAAAWLFGSGLIGLFGARKIRRTV